MGLAPQNPRHRCAGPQASLYACERRGPDPFSLDTATDFGGGVQ